MSKTDMKRYGFVKKYYGETNFSGNQKIGRVISRENENYKVITEIGIYYSQMSEKFKYSAKSLGDYPVIGDFVSVEINKDNFNSTIHEILKRKNELVRKGEWDENYDYVVAANIDTIFICLSLNNDFNIEKLQAYINVANKCTAEKILVLTECDSFNNIDDILNNTQKYTNDMDVVVTSSMDGDGCKSVKSYIQEGKTIIFIGPEHDKVRMVNKLLRDICFENDLVLIPGGGVLINTPEMRELGIENKNILKKLQIH